MMQAMAFFGALAVALPFVISSVAVRFGKAVAERFLERPGELPAEAGAKGPLTASMLQDWALGRVTADTAGHARGYAHRVMPLDLLYLISLGLFLGLAASYLAGLVGWPGWIASRPDWLWWILPLVYIAFDAAEDSLIVVLLSWPASITDASLKVLSVLRFVKIVSVGGAMGAAVLLGLLSFI
jgi:hypothetical protein